jgi:hypothetical protein
MSDQRRHDGEISSATDSGWWAWVLRLLAPGFGWCGRCGRPWKFTTYHSTAYRASRGCFPLCETCWSALTPVTRVPFYRRMWLDWSHTSEVEWSAIRRAVLEGK